MNQFASAAKSGASSVRQMIMGAGKTTVIAPILALMLADGESLVFNVMPAALLEQSLGIMRNAFSRCGRRGCTRVCQLGGGYCLVIFSASSSTPILLVVWSAGA